MKSVRLQFFFFSSRRRHTRLVRDWSSDVCSSDLHHRRRCAEVVRHRSRCSLLALLLSRSVLWLEGYHMQAIEVELRHFVRRLKNHHRLAPPQPWLETTSLATRKRAGRSINGGRSSRSTSARCCPAKALGRGFLQGISFPWLQAGFRWLSYLAQWAVA